VQPFLYGNTYGMAFQDPAALIYDNTSSTDSADIDTGVVNFGNFDPSEPLQYSAIDRLTIAYPPGGDVQVGVFVDVSALQQAGSPMAPQVSPVLSPKINGVSFFQNQAGVSLSSLPVISWAAPAFGTVSYYEVEVLALSRFSISTAAVMLTTETQVTVPPGVLSNGNSYAFVITAVVYNGVDLDTETFPPTLDLAGAPCTSGTIAFAGSAPQISRKALAANPLLGHLAALPLRHRNFIRQPDPAGRRSAVANRK
jgi:hypothetical protein